MNGQTKYGIYPDNGILFSHNRNKVLMKFENIMLSEKNRHKGHVLYDPIHKISRIGKSIEIEC